MAAKGKVVKKCGTDFKHKKWAVKGDERVKGRGSIPKGSLKILDKVYKDIQHTVNVSYCEGCVAYVTNHCSECSKNKVGVKDVHVQTVKDCKDEETQTKFSDFVDALPDTMFTSEGKTLRYMDTLQKRLAFI